MERIVGIDLGTSTSCLALIKNGEPVVVPDSRGARVTPSYIHVMEDGKILVGLQAKVEVISDPYSTIWATKRLIGRRFDDPEVQAAKKYFGYDIVAAPDGSVRVKGRDKLLSPTEISAIILKYLTRIGKRYTGEEIKKVVITVPAYFTDPQRKATREAGAMIGLDVVRLLNEPTAAALAYGYDQDTEQTIAIYDLGGGTFDLSILAMGQGVFEVVATEGDSYLGGEDFDNRLVDFLAADFKKKFGVDLFNDKMAHQRVKDAAERAKVALSIKDEVEINLPSLCPDVNRWAGIETVITKKQYEGMVGDLVDRTIIIFDRLLKSVAMSKKDIDNLILVGGMTRMPLVRRKVAEFYGRDPDVTLNPDEAVAIGAAIHAASLTGEKLVKKRRLVEGAREPAPPVAGEPTRPGISQDRTRPGLTVVDPGATKPAWEGIDQDKTRPGVAAASTVVRESQTPPPFEPPKPPAPNAPPPPAPPAAKTETPFDSSELPLDPSQVADNLPMDKAAFTAAATTSQAEPLPPAAAPPDLEESIPVGPEPSEPQSTAAASPSLFAGFEDFFFSGEDVKPEASTPRASSPIIVGGAAAVAAVSAAAIDAAAPAPGPEPPPPPEPGDEFTSEGAEPEPEGPTPMPPAELEPEPATVPEPPPPSYELPPGSGPEAPPGFMEPAPPLPPEPAPPPFAQTGEGEGAPIEMGGEEEFLPADRQPLSDLGPRPDLSVVETPVMPEPPPGYDDRPISAGPIIRDTPPPTTPGPGPVGAPTGAEPGPEPEYVPAPVLLDVLSQSVGIGHFGGHFVPLIKRFAKLPARATQIFTTCTDNQERIRISVLQGESRYQKDNTPLGEFVLDGIERARRGAPVIEVSFDIDQSGIFTVSARDQHTGAAREVKIESFTGGRSGPADQGRQV